MTVPKLWLCVPCCRESQLSWVMENLERQTARADVRLCIVENGPAIGACRRLGISADLVVTSEANVSHARNAAVCAVKTMRGDWMAMWDDDDWYGPRYLEEMIELTESGLANIYGKQRHFMALPEHGLFLFRVKDAGREIDWVHGPSLVFRAAEALPFKVCREGEEVQWCLEMKKQGAKVRAASIHHLLYLRWLLHSHTWDAENDWIINASAGEQAFYTLGHVDLAIVRGEVNWRDHVLQGFPGRSLQTLPKGTKGLIPLNVLEGRHANSVHFVD